MLRTVVRVLDMKEDLEDLFSGLQALSASAFPKRCNSCGRVYESVEAYLQQTQRVERRGGFKASLDDDDQPILELYRNCECGSTLMDFFSERRDASAQGERRRAAFGKALALLVNRGVSESTARKELLRVLRGHDSQVIRQLGLKLTAKGKGTDDDDEN